MRWFGGSIAEAVNLSKQRNSIFVVFVEGDNDLSKEMTSTIENVQVVSKLSDESNFLAIKLQSGSENYVHFAKIYQFVPVPSLFFIGRNGTPLEVVCAGVEADNLMTRIDRILLEHRKETPALQTLMQPSTSRQNIHEQTANLLQSEAKASVEANKPAASSSPATSPAGSSPPVNSSTVKHALPEDTSAKTPTAGVVKESKEEPAAKVPKLDAEYEVVCDGDVCVRRPINSAGPSQDASPTVENEPPKITTSTDEDEGLSLEEKMEKAKVLIEARRREKAEKDKELEKQRELERRMAGQGAAEFKRWKEEQEFKNIQEERKREKLENQQARQRILDQIAQDRAERRARDQPQPAAQPAAPRDTQNINTAGDGGTSLARIQFKLPDGSSHTQHFPVERTLHDLLAYTADILRTSPSMISLWTAFPRRQLTEADASLRDLNLTPSAAILVMTTRREIQPARQSPVSAVISFLSQLFTSLILQPSQQLYSWLSSRLFPPVAPPSSPDSTHHPADSQPGLRRRGNVHRLTGDQSADDDNNTWNGNSTQQM